MPAQKKLARRILSFLEDRGFFDEAEAEKVAAIELLGLKDPPKKAPSAKKGRTLQIYVDGSSDLVKKQAGLGGVFYLDGEQIYEFSEPRPGLTNNEAEYDALIFALDLAVQFEVDGIEVYSDSQLMVNQLNGSYKVKNDRLKPRYARIMKLSKQRSSIRFTHVYRTENKHADRLAREALKTAVDNARKH